MPGRRYDYNASTYDAATHLEVLNREVRDFAQSRPLDSEENRKVLLARLLRRAGMAAYRGAAGGEGGPFGALLVDFHTESGVPQVVGFGTNHVVPGSDPTAHAEMSAIRDAAARLGRTDLSGLTLVSSCECCPMCLSAATGCKVESIYFGATREDAARAGFVDNDQYRLMKAGGMEQHGQRAGDIAQAERRLDGHDAVAELNFNGALHRYYGDADAQQGDPTALPVVQAIRHACAGLSSLKAARTGEAQPVFHLPADTAIVSRRKPHPLSLVAADWARIGRVRGADPDNPLHDLPGKDATRIEYLSDEPEAMTVRGPAGSDAVDPARVWEEIHAPRAVHVPAGLGRARLAAFDKWENMFRTPDDSPKTVRRY